MRTQTLQNKIYGLGKNMICTKKFSTSIFIALVSLATPVLASNFSNFFSGGKVMYLVKGDGTTKIGPVMSYVRYDTSATLFDLVYVSPDTGLPVVSTSSGTTSLLSILGGAPTPVYYSGTDCTGTAYLHYTSGCHSVDSGCFNPTYNGGTYLIQMASANLTPQSRRNPNGTCHTGSQGFSTYSTINTTPAHPLCGDKPCKLKLMAP